MLSDAFLEYTCLKQKTIFGTLKFITGTNFMPVLVEHEISFITTGPEVIKLFPCSTQLSTKLILLINVNNFLHFNIY